MNLKIFGGGHDKDMKRSQFSKVPQLNEKKLNKQKRNPVF